MEPSSITARIPKYLTCGSILFTTNTIFAYKKSRYLYTYDVLFDNDFQMTSRPFSYEDFSYLTVERSTMFFFKNDLKKLSQLLSEYN